MDIAELIRETLVGPPPICEKAEGIFVCGPWSHNKIPGSYVDKFGRRHHWYSNAAYENNRGWRQRLAPLYEQIPGLYVAESTYREHGIGDTGPVLRLVFAVRDGWEKYYGNEMPWE